MDEKAKQIIFDGMIERKWGTSVNPPVIPEDADPDMKDDDFEEYEDNDEET